MNSITYQPALAVPGAAAAAAVAAASSPFEAAAYSEDAVLESSCESAKFKLKSVTLIFAIFSIYRS